MQPKGKKITSIIGAIILYLFSAGSSYAIFSYILVPAKITTVENTTTQTDSNGFEFDPSIPRTEPCPINGQLRTKQEKDLWEKRRPLGIMVENHEDARPQSGLSSADVIYEAVAEGGITRFLAVFYCGNSETVGPVRSARTYYLDFISEYGANPLYTHVGGANTPGPANALGQIDDYGWALQNDLNQFSIGFPTFWRDYERLGHEVATEHTVYTSTAKLWEVAKKRGFTNVDENGDKWDETFVPWKFKEDLDVSKRPASSSATFAFWDSYDKYNVKWAYDPKINSYKRFNGGVPHLDKNTNKQLIGKNIVLAFMTEENANDGYENNLHMIYGTIGTGKAVILTDGGKTEGTWEKEDRLSRTIFKDENGEEVSFDRGQIWIEILPKGTKVTYQ